MTEKTWMEVEMDETVTLLRKRLEELNNTPPDEVDCDVVHELKDIYKALYYLFSVKKAMG
nr:MAG TPA: Nonstructural protein 4 tetramer NSP4 Rotavirus Coiled-coil.6A [Caudoviricetes sp.]